MDFYKINKDTLELIKVNKFKYLTKYVGITIGVLLIVGIFSSFKYLEQSKKEFIQSEEIINLITNDSFSKERLIQEVKSSNFQYPDIIIAQAYIESSHFTSPVFKENNNVFGMRLPGSRFTLATGDNLKHAVYNNWKDCVKDRLIYEALYLNNISKEQYYQYLDKIYARSGGVSYSNLIKRVIKDKALE